MHMSCIGRPGWSVSPSRADRLCDLILHEYKFVSRRPIPPPSLSLSLSFSVQPVPSPFERSEFDRRLVPSRGRKEEGWRDDRDATLMVAPAGVGDRLAALVADIVARFRGPSAVLRDEDISNRTGLVVFATWEGISGYFHDRRRFSFREQCNLFSKIDIIIDNIYRISVTRIDNEYFVVEENLNLSKKNYS